VTFLGSGGLVCRCLSGDMLLVRLDQVGNGVRLPLCSISTDSSLTPELVALPSYASAMAAMRFNSEIPPQ